MNLSSGCGHLWELKGVIIQEEAHNSQQLLYKQVLSHRLLFSQPTI